MSTIIEIIGIFLWGTIFGLLGTYFCVSIYALLWWDWDVVVNLHLWLDPAHNLFVRIGIFIGGILSIFGGIIYKQLNG